MSSIMQLVIDNKKGGCALKTIGPLFDDLADRAVIRITAIELFQVLPPEGNVTWTRIAQELKNFLNKSGQTETRTEEQIAKPVSRFILGKSPGDTLIVRALALYVLWKSETTAARRQRSFEACFNLTDIFHRVRRSLENLLMERSSGDSAGGQIYEPGQDEQTQEARRARYRTVAYLAAFVEKHLIALGAEPPPIKHEDVNHFESIGINQSPDEWRLDSNEREIHLHTRTLDGRFRLIAHTVVGEDWTEFSSWKYAGQIASDLLDQTQRLKLRKESAGL